MTDAAINAVLRRDRTIVLSAIVAITALAWAYVLWLAANMDMGMGSSMGTSMGNMCPCTAEEVCPVELVAQGYTRTIMKHFRER